MRSGTRNTRTELLPESVLAPGSTGCDEGKIVGIQVVILQERCLA
jgi:hypothetical protein